MNTPLHICHVVLSLRSGGLENGVVNVVNGLDPARFRSSVCCLQQRGEFARRLRGSVAVIEMGLKPGKDLRLPFRLAKVFRALQVDIVHTRNPEPFFYGAVAARLAGVPVVIHSEHGRIFPEKPLRVRVQRWLLRGTSAAFAVSEALRQELIREIGVKPATFEVVHNGVDLDRFRPCRGTAGRCVPGAVVVGSVGRLVPVKNYPLLIRAMAQLPRESSAPLLLVGDGPERAALEDLARRLNLTERVRFAGHRDDIPEALQEMDIFVLPSTSEGMSNTLLEAMAAGVTVLASDVGGNGEIVENGVSGLLFPSGDVDCATEKLRLLIADAQTRRRLARAGEARVRAEFSVEGMLHRYEELYWRVWSRAHGHPSREIAY
jgi:sugar transferase (PEP-CTERM/EpsH1 system associated)